MKLTKRFSLLIMIVALVAVLVAAAEPAMAQCAMCKQAAAGSEEAQSVSKAINLAILVLLFPPVAIFVGIFGAFYRSRNREDQEEVE